MSKLYHTKIREGTGEQAAAQAGNGVPASALISKWELGRRQLPRAGVWGWETAALEADQFSLLPRAQA